MVHRNSSIENQDTFQDTEINIPRPVRFWLFSLLDLPSIICSLFLLYHLLFNKNLRNQLTNHIIIVLLIIGLIIELIDIPFHLTFLRSGVVKPSTQALCLIWWFMDLGLYNGCTIIMAWGSVERYLLVFYDRMFFNKNKRFIFHYFPLFILLLYISIFYIMVIVFPPCKNTYDYALPVCNDFPCYLNDPVLGIMDSVLNSILPTIVISVASISMIIRVWFQKRRLHRRNLWRKQRRMIIQLLSSSTLYLIPNLPLSILIFAHLCGLPRTTGVEAQLYFDFLCYFVILFYPFVCLGILSDLRKKIKWQRFFLVKQPHQVATVKPQYYK